MYIQRDGKNVKVIPSNIDTLLTPLAIAYWIAGDGHFNNQQGALFMYTNSFTVKEVNRLSSILFTKFDIHSTCPFDRKSKEQCIIRIPKRAESAISC
jgi:hypothetical protein